MVKFVSAYAEKDKKILKKWIFASKPLRILSFFRSPWHVRRKMKMAGNKNNDGLWAVLFTIYRPVVKMKRFACNIMNTLHCIICN